MQTLTQSNKRIRFDLIDYRKRQDTYLFLKILNIRTPRKKLTIATLFIIAVACVDEKVETRSYPVVNTYAVTDITEQGAVLNGEILNLSDGVTNHGFVYGADHITSANAFSLDSISLGTAREAEKFSMLANRNLANGKTYFVRAFAVGRSGAIVLGQEKSFVAKGGAAPTIKDFNPKQGTAGDTIIMVGSGFSTNPEYDEVRFNQALSPISKARPDSLWVIVPVNTMLNDSTVSVQVGGQKVVASQKFHLLKMTATSFEPSLVSYGDTVTIHGTNFPLDRSMLHGVIFQKQAVVAANTRTMIKAVITQDPVASTSPLAVNAGSQTVSIEGPIKLKPPVISSFTPTKGTGNSIVTLAGDYFNPDKTKNKVTLAGKTLEVTEATVKTLKVKLPVGITPGTYSFVVSIFDLTGTSSTQFQIVTPIITAVAPLNGTWKMPVTITGENFGSTPADNIVTFSGFPATVTAASPTQLTVLVPIGLYYASSLISVQSKTTDNLSATFSTPFILDKPEISSFTPAEAKPGSQITITGKNFYPTGANTVSFGGKNLEVISQNATQLIAIAASPVDMSDFLTVTSVGGGQTASATKFHLISPWRQIASFAGGARANSVAFSIGNYGYVGFGSESASPKYFYRYDPSVNTWSKTTDVSNTLGFDSPSFTSASAFTINNYAYVAGFYPNVSYVGTTVRYDPSTDSWALMKTLDTYNENLNDAVGFAGSGKGYISTGLLVNGVPSARTMQYDPVTNTWTQTQDLPGSPRSQAASFTIGSDGYVIGGACSGCVGYSKEVWKFDTSSSAWTRMTDTPTGQYGGTGFAIDGKGYLIAGLDNSGSYGYNVLMYDPVTNTWQTVATVPGDSRMSAVAFVVGSKAYFGTGKGYNGFLADFWEFDPSKL